MKNIHYECPRELTKTEWKYIGTSEKVIDEGEQRVHEYRCMDCKKASLYITTNKLEEVLEHES